MNGHGLGFSDAPAWRLCSAGRSGERSGRSSAPAGDLRKGGTGDRLCLQLTAPVGDSHRPIQQLSDRAAIPIQPNDRIAWRVGPSGTDQPNGGRAPERPSLRRHHTPRFDPTRTFRSSDRTAGPGRQRTGRFGEAARRSGHLRPDGVVDSARPEAVYPAGISQRLSWVVLARGSSISSGKPVRVSCRSGAQEEDDTWHVWP
jgi:hypothetical protein